MTRQFLILFLAAFTAGRVIAQDDTNAPAAPSALSKTALESIVRKNIFDPTRTGNRPRQRGPRIQSFTFCGGAFDGPRSAAIFSGAGAPDHALQPGDTINGFKIGAINFTAVKLKPSDGPELTLAMGMSMRRTDNGPWKASGEAAPEPTDSTATNGPPASTISASDSDIIKRLKAKREEN